MLVHKCNHPFAPFRKLARRAGMMKAKVALARKLAVVLHRMWVDAIKFDADKASGCVRVAA